MISRTLLTAICTLSLVGDRPPLPDHHPLAVSVQPDPLASIEDVMIPQRVAPSLTVNLLRSFRTVVRKNERDGIADLVNLSKTADTEEAYAYLPSEEKWMEIGYGESNLVASGENEELGGELSIYLDQQFIYFLFSQYASLTIYHIHPDCFVDQLSLLVKNDPPPKQKVIDRLAFLRDIHVLPSRDDISSALLISAQFYQQYQPRGEILFKVVSSHGVATFQVTNELKRDFIDQNYESALDFALLISDAYSALDREALWKESSGDRAAFVQSLNYLGVQIEYTPFSKKRSSSRKKHL